MNEICDKLRALRKARGMSLSQLSRRVGCSPSYLSMVENAKVDPSVSRLKVIAEALEVTIIDLFQGDTIQEVVVRRDKRLRGKIIGSKTDIEILVPNVPEKNLDARLATIHPGGSSMGNYQHPGQEFGFVLSGSLELTVNGAVHMLEQGDSFYFESDRQHRYRNISKEDAVVVWVNHPPTW